LIDCVSCLPGNGAFLLNQSISTIKKEGSCRIKRYNFFILKDKIMSTIPAGNKNQIAVNFTEEIWDRGNLKIADEIFSKDFIDHDPVTGQLPGLDGYKQMVMEFRNAFPDLRVKNEDVIVEGNKVVVRWWYHS